MKFTFLFCLLFISTATAQTAAPILATAAGKNFTLDSLSMEAQDLYAKQGAVVASYRAELLSKMVADVLLDMEARSLSVTREKLISAIESKIPEPTAARIQSVYELNRAQLGNRSLEESRTDIVRYLRQEVKEKAVADLVNALKQKYKVSMLKDVNAPGLQEIDTIVTVGGRSITLREFEMKNGSALNDRKHNIYWNLRGELEAAILSVLVGEEASERGVDPGSIIAAEITNKLKNFTADERSEFEAALQKRLFTKFAAKIMLPEPAPYIQNISVDDDPASGPAKAPVVVVMFSDFQCSSCAATHPMLKRVIAEFPGRIRLVIRDYPLIDIHENAFVAALAANAANRQGKFFEFIEILYSNQSALDPVSLRKHASRLGLNLKQFELDLNDPNSAAEVKKDLADGASYGVAWTPSIYVNGSKLHRMGIENIREAIAVALKK